MTVQEFMSISGVPLHMRGYDLIKESLEMLVENPNMSICKIDDTLARNRNSSNAAIKSNIRTAIVRGYPKLDANIKNVLFGNAEKISTAEYLKSIATAIRNNII